MEINVLDAIMGSGKTQAAITWMNEHPDKKYIYVTPYLSEAERIKKACPRLDFAEPSSVFKKTTKTKDAEKLISEGRNIACSHSLFRYFTRDILAMVEEKKYRVIIDEALDIYNVSTYRKSDLEILMDCGYVVEEDGAYKRTGKEYVGGVYRKLLNEISIHEPREDIVIENKVVFACWSLPLRLLEAAEKVFILTYLFEGQDMYYYFKMNGVEYRKIGVWRDRRGTYRFATHPMGTSSDLKSKIHIFDNKQYNNIQKKSTDFSANWYKKAKEKELAALRNRINNYLTYYHKQVPASQKIWTAFIDQKDKVSRNGYRSSFVPFNLKATNDYRDKTVLVYAVNVYAHPGIVNFLQKQGIEYDEDARALSIMVQWIWRSAIRDGKEISIYIPSKRMRKLLTDWLDKIS